MIQKITLTRFKKFKNVEVHLGPFSILMGENSSGKTTVMQAMNLALNSLSQYPYITVNTAGAYKIRTKGVSMNRLPGLSLSDNRELFYAKKKGQVIKGSKSIIDPGAIIEVIDDMSNIYKLTIIENFGSFNIKCNSTTTDISNNPQLHLKAPLFISGFIGLKSVEERVFPMVIQDRMRSGDVSTVIRNLVLDTKNNAEDAYNRLKNRLKNDFNFQIEKVEFNDQHDLNVAAYYSEMFDKKSVSLDFMSSGSGFMQILQILTPIYRFCPDVCSIVLLDEPDAHLHPNLQTALARTLRDIQKELDIQIIISTHSTSIIRAAEPSEVIPISSISPINKPLVTSAEVESKILESIDAYELGKSVISGQLAFTEDANSSVIERFDQVLGIGALTGANTIPIIRGRGKDDKSPFLLHEVLEEFLSKDIKISVIRDRDGLTQDWVDALKAYADKKKVALHIFDRYEIENYLLSPELIFRAINKRKDYSHLVSVESIREKLSKFLDETIKLSKYDYNGVLEDNISKSGVLIGKDEYRSRDTSKGAAKTITKAYEGELPFEQLVVVGMGKEALKALMKWLNEDRKISFSNSDILSVIEPADIPEEISLLLQSLRSKESKTVA
ncbi:MAG: AAA family ATPase [Janthinobacterium lividum]